MKKYPEFKTLDYAQMAKEILTFWEREKIFEQSVSIREGSPIFTFYEGPPSANGTPGIHHVMARTVKDIFCRFKTLQGFQVKRKGGWDTHGLPVELQVEKQLNITKEDIGKTISIAEYNQRCRETVMMYKDQWDDLTKKMGYWVDLDDPYITYTNNYIETLWWILKQLYSKGLLYKGYSIQPYSPSDGTGLSSHELNQPGCYKDVKDTSIVAQFAVKNTSKSKFLFDKTNSPVYVLAWTTTPWTLPSNTALAVGKNIVYAQIDTFNPYTFEPVSVILAKELIGRYFSEKQAKADMNNYQKGDKVIPYRLVQECTGQQLSGITYEQLMPFVTPLKNPENAFVIAIGDFVTTEDGTGIVHASPTFGADDFKLAQQHGIPALTVIDDNGQEVPVVDKQGKFVDEIGQHLSEKVNVYSIKTHKPLGASDFFVKNYTHEDETLPDYKSTDVILSIILKEENKAFKVEKYEHSYPHSWRTDMPVLYYPLDSWFIRTTSLKQKLIDLNKTINWKPANTGTGRFGDWLENLVDWNLSRSRFWGTPLPIWRTEDGQEEICIGSLEELRGELEKSKKAGLVSRDIEITKEFDLHRPYVDDIVLISPKGQPMHREPDLIDVWFDSGAMPYAQWHFPFENKDVFEQAFPADFIAEGVDQTRGWFFTLHAIATMLSACSDEVQEVNQKKNNQGVAFKNVISNGLVLDQEGNKMSKRKGNVVDPFKALDEYGADVIRWYLIENAPPWENLKYSDQGVEEIKRRFFGTLFNTYSFFTLYANIDGFNKEEKSTPFEQRPMFDQWILSRLQSMVSDVTLAYEQYEPTKATRVIQEFVIDHLSNWYIRLNRKRFWQPSLRGSLSTDKRSAYDTLFECLITTAQLISPVAPFLAEWLYQNLTQHSRGEAINQSAFRFNSIHHTLLPKPDDALQLTSLDASMNYAQRICSLVHSIRKTHKIKVRTPLQRILLPILNPEFEQQLKSVEEIIKAEVNVKEVQCIDDTSGVVVKKVKPNFPRLGKQFGAKMKEVTAVIQSLTKEEISLLESTSGLSKNGFDLTIDDVIVMSEDIPGWAVANDGTLMVALDITLTDALKEEGLARDFVNRIQNLRKDLGMEVLDKIDITIQSAGEVMDTMVRKHHDYISSETQAKSIQVTEAANENFKDIDLEEMNIKVMIKVI